MTIKRKKTITYKGETAKVSLMAHKYGVPIRTILRRIQAGWTDDECVAGKAGRKNTRVGTIKVMYQGLDYTLKQWASIRGVSVHTLTSRHRRGWSADQILYGKD